MKNVILWSFDPFIYDNIKTIEKIQKKLNIDNIKIAIWDIRKWEKIFDLEERSQMIKSYWIESSNIIIIKTKDDLFDLLRSANNLIKTHKDAFVKNHLLGIGKEFWISKRLEKNTTFVNISQNTEIVSWKKIIKSVYDWWSYNAVSNYINEYTYNEIKNKIEENR